MHFLSRRARVALLALSPAVLVAVYACDDSSSVTPPKQGPDAGPLVSYVPEAGEAGDDDGWDAGDDAADGAAHSAVVGTLGDPCSPVGALGCAGHAQKGQLLCGVDHRWASNGVCAGASNCDTRVGMNAGSCQPIADGCLDRSPNATFCDEVDGGSFVVARRCGPDLVTRTDTDCVGGIGFCYAGSCVECLPGTPPSCSGGSLTTCDATGTTHATLCSQGCAQSPQPRCADCAEGTVECEGVDGGTGTTEYCQQGSWDFEGTACSPACSTASWSVDPTHTYMTSPLSSLKWNRTPSYPQAFDLASQSCAGRTTSSWQPYRLPTVAELQGLLYQVATCTPAVDQAAFPNTTPGPNWTSEVSTDPDSGVRRVRTVDMTTGAVSDADPSQNLGSRCIVP
jgi:hypothetical protein